MPVSVTLTGKNLFGGASVFSRITNSTVDQISNLAQGALCMSMFAIQQLLNPAALLGSLKDFLLNTITSQISNIANLLDQMVAKKLAELGMIVKTVLGILGAAAAAIDAIKNLSFSLDKRAFDINLSFENNLNCATTNALLARCLQGEVNKLLTNKVVSALGVTKTVDDITNYALTNMAQTDVFAKFTDKMSTSLNKAECSFRKNAFPSPS
ncbi:MAG: hypothetical protein EBU90_27245, partial [Proteobacteria bacterium]|nr:hypothetical protein [Pseudomonadota bacterium]